MKTSTLSAAVLGFLAGIARAQGDQNAHHHHTLSHDAADAASTQDPEIIAFGQKVYPCRERFKYKCYSRMKDDEKAIAKKVVEAFNTPYDPKHPPKYPDVNRGGHKRPRNMNDLSKTIFQCEELGLAGVKNAWVYAGECPDGCEKVGGLLGWGGFNECK